MRERERRSGEEEKEEKEEERRGQKSTKLRGTKGAEKTRRENKETLTPLFPFLLSLSRSLPTPFPLSTSKDIEKGDAIPLPNVSSKILSKIIGYCRFHSEHAEKKKASEASAEGGGGASGSAGATTDDDVKDHDAEFVKVDQSTLFELILAANYLNIKPLLDLTCLTVANMIKGKTPEEIRKTFNIPNDFTPEEEEEVRRENQWAFE